MTLRDSERYLAQAEQVARMAAKADSAAEREVYLNIAEGWRKLAAEAYRNEGHDEVRAPREERSFRPARHAS
ncbi:hypothetical protein [Phenylobacterium sp.]|jgi:hypothetical protein|uniref:hypothetical protein n=1 Tax=Phenylobacterium sp. TaxID=1871053 RepID=UPI002F94854A